MLKCNTHALFMESNIDLSMWKACNSDLYFFTEGFFLNRKFAYHIYNGFSVTCLKVTLKTLSIPHCEDGTTNRRGHNFSFFLTALKYKINSSHPVSPLFIIWHKSWQSFFMSQEHLWAGNIVYHTKCHIDSILTGNHAFLTLLQVPFSLW